MNEQNERVLSWLKGNTREIVGRADMQQILFVQSTWECWFREATWSDSLVNRVFSTASEGTISRNQIRGFAEGARTSEDFRVLFALTMIWGRGKSNGRMKNHLISILRNPSLDQALNVSRHSLRTDGPAAAYKAWTDSGITGIGPAFFTKWLWAAGCCNPAGNQALVLDARVWASLGALDWNSIEAAGSRKRADRYSAFVKSCEQWSRSIPGSTAEDVEWALFDWNGGNNSDSHLASP